MSATKTFPAALRLVRERGALTLVPELVDAVAGEPVRGSWWAHPAGKAIFDLATKLEESGEVVTAKLVDRKVTFLHARLWPPLVRVVTDRGWRRRRASALDEDGRRLLARVERAGRLASLDRAAAPARKRLEIAVLVRSTQDHTDTGRHEIVLESWRAWAEERNVTGAASAIPLAEALAILAVHRIELA